MKQSRGKIMKKSWLQRDFPILLVTLLSVQQVTTALEQATVNSEDKSTDLKSNPGYHSSGCYKDTEARAIPSMEGTDPSLTGFYKQRQEPITKCAAVAKARGFQLFAIQNGGMCLSGPKAHETFKINGQAENCKDGKGGEWASDVYSFNDFPLELHIFTGTEPEAGTDANVYITLSGSLGSSRKVSLTPTDASQNPFEAGQTDVFNIHTIPLGAISGITIGHDETGSKAADWFLRKIVVKDAANSMYKFEVNSWLGKDKGKAEKDLSLTATITPGSYKPIGCFKERTDVNKDRAVPSMEGKDDILDGVGTTSYQGREFPIEKCADAAKRRGYVMFAIQDGGLCASSKEMQNTYDTYGKGDDCMVNGTGSEFSSSVYSFSDHEPRFKDAELSSASGAEEVSKSEQGQATPTSDPAMQVAAGQISSSPTNTQSSSNHEATNTILNKHNVSTPSVGPTSTSSSVQPESNGNQGGVGSTSQVLQNKESPRQSMAATDTLSGANLGGANKPESVNTPMSQATQVTQKQDSNTITPGAPTGKTGRVKEDQDITNGNTGTTKPNGPENNDVERANKNAEKISNNPIETDVTPEVNSGRVDNKIPKPENEYKLEEGNSVGGESPVKGKSPVGGTLPIGSRLIEPPLSPKVHKIAPETRLPGEFTSPSNNNQNLVMKTKTRIVRRPFSKLLDARQRDKIFAVQ